MEYRLANNNDTDRLAELCWERKAEEKTLDVKKKQDFIQYCSGFIKTLFEENYCCWIAAENGQIISHIYVITVKKVPTPENLNSKWAYLTTARTIPEYRNRGIGTALMARVKIWCDEQGFGYIRVHPSKRSVAYYERAGFKRNNDVMDLLLK
ncbi:MAG: GNAT family N-acetyltransferase [Oscillospiraceae bacterium]|nr:GNAT family N-acetyltransferase [Oscillospiraceae bacterium]